MNASDEVSRIRASYDRRQATYDPCEAWVYKTRQDVERGLIEILRRAGQLPLRGKSVLEMGCGTGGNMLQLLRLGVEPQRLVGCELLEERVQEARRYLPAETHVVSGNALEADVGQTSFDIVFQSLVFSSILDATFQEQLAQRMWSLTRPGGGVLWYDFVYNNPRNPDVAGVTLRRVRALFPEAAVIYRRTTLAPPISRLVTKLNPSLYSVFGAVPLLRTHIICWLQKLA